MMNSNDYKEKLHDAIVACFENKRNYDFDGKVNILSETILTIIDDMIFAHEDKYSHIDPMEAHDYQ